MGAIDMTKKPGNLLFAENGYGLGFFLGPDMGNLPIQGLVKHLPVKKDDGIKGLPLRGRRYRPFYRQVGKKTLHIPDTKVPEMGLAAKKMDKTHYPLAVGLLGAAGIMIIAQHLAHLLHELEFRIGMKSRLIFHVIPLNITIDGKANPKSNMWKIFSTLGIPI